MLKPTMPHKKPSLMTALKNPAQVKDTWLYFQKLPFGKALFSKVMGWIIPYTGKMSAMVQKIEPGHAEVQLQDCRKVRNHLRSIHAIALANLGEFCCGLALFSRVPTKAQAILVKLDCTYLKKARGLLTASSHLQQAEFQSDADYAVTAEIRDSSQAVVAIVNTTWRVRI